MPGHKPDSIFPDLEVDLLVTRAERKRRKSLDEMKAPKKLQLSGKKKLSTQSKTPRASKLQVQPRHFIWERNIVTVEPCATCPLNKGKQVWHEGDLKTAKVMIVGEHPGYYEDQTGKPFSGKVGQWFRKVLKEAGFVPEEYVLTNVVKCNTDKAEGKGTQEAINNCASYFLRKEIEESAAEYILVCGRLAMNLLLNLDSIHHARGKIYTIGNKKLLPTLHPAGVLRNPEDELIFKSDITRLKELVSGKVAKPVNYTLVRTIEQLAEAKKRLFEAEDVYFDIEYPVLDPWAVGSRVTCVSASVEDYQAYCFITSEPLIEHHKIEVTAEQAKSMLVDFFESSVPKGGQYVKSDCRYLQVVWGVEVKNVLYDSILSHYLIDARRGTHGLDILSWTYLGEAYDENVVARIGTDLEQLAVDEFDKFVEYSCQDSDRCRRVDKILLKEIKKQELTYPLTNIIIPGSAAFVQIEIAGMKVDVPALLEYKQQQEKKRDELLGILNAYVPESTEPKWTSGDFVAWLLFEVYKMPVFRRTEGGETKEGRPAVDDEALQFAFGKVLEEGEASENVRLMRTLFEFNTLMNEYKTYTNGWLKFIKPDGKLHTTYTLDIAVTGRTSSTQPNLQNVPKEFRRFIIPSWEGGRIVSGDYKAAEVRIGAILANETNLIQLFNDGKDPYRFLSANALDKTEDEVTSDERDQAKPAFLARMYLGQAETVAGQLGVPVAKAQLLLELIDKYFPRLRIHADEVKKSVLKTHEVICPLNKRRRRFPSYLLEGKETQNHCIRQAVNFPHQTTASDLNLIASARIVDFFSSENLQSKVCSNVHDSISVDSPPEEPEQAALIVKTMMEELDLPWLSVPMKSDVKIGNNWATGEKFLS